VKNFILKIIQMPPGL